MKKYFLTTLQFSIPMILSKTGAQILTMLNVAMIGQYGSKELALFGLTSSPYFTFVLIALCMTSGIPIVFAKNKLNSKVVTEKLLVSLMHFGFLSIAFVIICAGLVFYFHNSDMTKIFFLLLLAAPAFIGVFISSSILEALGHPKIPAQITMMGIPFNFVLNLAAISLLSPVYGITAACVIGMGITRWVMLLMLIYQIYKVYKPQWDQQNIKNLNFSNLLSDFKNDLAFGFPISIAYGLRSAGTTTLIIFIARYGTADVAAFSIVSQILMLGTLISRGVSSASIIKVSEFLGKNLNQNLEKLVYSSVAVSVMLVSLLALVFSLLPQIVLKVFTNDVIAIQKIVVVMVPIVLMLIIDGLASVLIGVLRPLGDRWLPQTIFGLSIWLTPLLLIAIPEANFSTVLQTLVFTQLISLALIGWRWKVAIRHNKAV